MMTHRLGTESSEARSAPPQRRARAISAWWERYTEPPDPASPDALLAAMDADWCAERFPAFHRELARRELRAAVCVAQEVPRTAGTGPIGLRLAGRAFAWALARADAETQRAALALLATRAAKNEPLADAATVRQSWRWLAELVVHRPVVRPLRRRVRDRRPEPLPVEAARAVPLDQLLERLGFTLRRVGREYVTCCPFHRDEHPSLRVNVERGWYCFVCNIGGDGIAFVERLRGADFAAAVEEVARC